MVKWSKFVRILGYFWCIVIAVSKKIICEFEQTVYLQRDEFYFVETPNFPQSIKNDCQIIFKINSSQNLNADGIFFGITNGILRNATVSYANYSDKPSNIFLVDDFYDTTELKLQITAAPSYYNAFHGMVMLDDRSSKNCVFDYLSSSAPYDFKDETELFLIASPFKKISENNYSINCTWFFTAPYLYKFKIEYFGTLNDREIMILDNGDVKTFVNNSYLENAYQYLSGGGFYAYSVNEYSVFGYNLMLTYDALSKEDSVFYCIISVVKIVPDIVKENCTVTKNGNVITWTNLDTHMRGYSNNARCSFNLTVPWKNELLMYPEIFNLKYPDVITMYINNKPVRLSSDQSLTQYLQSKEIGNQSNVFFEFVSDGNAPSLGFKFTFTEKECNCGPSKIVVPCEGKHTYNIMGNEDNRFCGNLRCNFSIIADPMCSHKNIIMTASEFYGFKNSASIKIISDNITYFVASEFLYAYDEFEIPLLSNRTNILYFSSFKSNSLKFSARTQDPITVSKSIILSFAHPFHVLDLEPVLENSVLTIKLDDYLTQSNDTLQMFYNYYYDTNYVTFTNENLTKLYKLKQNINDINKSLMNVILPTNSLTLYFSRRKYGFIIFRAIKSHTRNCSFTETIVEANSRFSLGGYNDKNRFTMLAKPNGDCEMIVIYPNSIKQWWTSASNRAVKLFTAYSKPLFEFNSLTAHLWNSLLLYVDTIFYRVIIPANASLILDIANTTIKNKSLLSSPSYDQCLQNSVKYNDFFTKKENSTFIFKILDLQLSPSASLFLNDQKVNNTGQTFSFHENKVNLTYEENECGCFGYLLRVDEIENE